MSNWTDGEPVEAPEKTKDGPSRWWIVYHIWAGLSLKVFIDVTGIWAWLTNVFSSVDGAPSNVAFTAVIIAIAIVWIGYTASKRLIDIVNNAQLQPSMRKVIIIALPILYPFTAIILAYGLGQIT